MSFGAAPYTVTFYTNSAGGYALAGTTVPDFPVTNKSFNLSYAGNDL